MDSTALEGFVGGHRNQVEYEHLQRRVVWCSAIDREDEPATRSVRRAELGGHCIVVARKEHGEPRRIWRPEPDHGIRAAGSVGDAADLVSHAWQSEAIGSLGGCVGDLFFELEEPGRVQFTDLQGVLFGVAGVVPDEHRLRMLDLELVFAVAARDRGEGGGRHQFVARDELGETPLTNAGTLFRGRNAVLVCRQIADLGREVVLDPDHVDELFGFVGKGNVRWELPPGLSDAFAAESMLGAVEAFRYEELDRLDSQTASAPRTGTLGRLARVVGRWRARHGETFNGTESGVLKRVVRACAHNSESPGLGFVMDWIHDIYLPSPGAIGQ